MELSGQGNGQRFVVLSSCSLPSVWVKDHGLCGVHLSLSLTCERGGSHCSQMPSDQRADGCEDKIAFLDPFVSRNTAEGGVAPSSERALGLPHCMQPSDQGCFSQQHSKAVFVASPN